MWELGAGEVALVGVWLRCAPLASGLLGVGVGRAHTPNKAPGPYAWGDHLLVEMLGTDASSLED